MYLFFTIAFMASVMNGTVVDVSKFFVSIPRARD